MLNATQHDILHYFHKYLGMDLRIVHEYRLDHVDSHCLKRIAVDNMVHDRCNFQRMSKLDDLVLFDKLRMDRMVMENKGSVVHFQRLLLELNGTIQMDFLFRQEDNYKLDCD